MEPSHYLVYFRGYYSPFHFQYTLIVLQDHSKAQSKQVALLCALHLIHGLSECLPCHKYQLHKAEEVLFVDLWQPVLHFAVCLLLTYAVRVSETVTQSPIIHHQWHFAESCCLMLLLAAIVYTFGFKSLSNIQIPDLNSLSFSCFSTLSSLMWCFLYCVHPL